MAIFSAHFCYRKTGILVHFRDFLAANWEKSPIFLLGKGPTTCPKFSLGKSLTIQSGEIGLGWGLPEIK